MDYEREFDPQELLMGNGEENSIILPAAFIHKLSESRSLKMVLDTFSEWVNILFYADRVSLTLYNNQKHLELYSISGNQAIPLDFKVPIDQSFVGRAFTKEN
jgi:hypothetical protein